MINSEVLWTCGRRAEEVDPASLGEKPGDGEQTGINDGRRKR